MIEKYSTARVDSRFFEVYSDLSWLKEKINDLVTEPTAEAAEEVDSMFTKFAADCESLRNSITTLAKAVAGVDVDANGEMEIDVVPEQNGLRMS